MNKRLSEFLLEVMFLVISVLTGLLVLFYCNVFIVLCVCVWGGPLKQIQVLRVLFAYGILVK